MRAQHASKSCSKCTLREHETSVGDSVLGPKGSGCRRGQLGSACCSLAQAEAMTASLPAPRERYASFCSRYRAMTCTHCDGPPPLPQFPSRPSPVSRDPHLRPHSLHLPPCWHPPTHPDQRNHSQRLRLTTPAAARKLGKPCGARRTHAREPRGALENNGAEPPPRPSACPSRALRGAYRSIEARCVAHERAQR
jgi:hypothetical protein